MGISHGTGIPVIPARREIPEAREIPGREKFEAIREGGNGNFPLNITEMGVIRLGVMAGGVVRDVEVRHQGERGLICDNVIHRGVTRWSSKGVSLLLRAPI